MKCEGDKREDEGIVSAMIHLDVKCGNSEEAIHFWKEWQRMERMPNAILCICVFSACASLGIHPSLCWHHLYSKISGHQMMKHNIKLFNNILNMFLKCGDVEMVFKVLEEDGIIKFGINLLIQFFYGRVLNLDQLLSVTFLTSSKNEDKKVAMDDTLYNSMIGITKCGDPRTALKMRKEILYNNSNNLINATTYTCMLGAASGVGDMDALKVGKEIFKKTEKLYLTDVRLAIALVTMFAKGGLPEKNLEIWQSINQ